MVPGWTEFYYRHIANTLPLPAIIMTDSTQTMTFEESVRKRPFLYLGNDRLVGLFEGLLLDCISLCKTDKIAFQVIISGDNKFSFVLSSQHDLQSFIKQFSDENPDLNNYMPSVLKAISENIEIFTSVLILVKHIQLFAI